LRRIAKWLKPGGKLFLHIFTHCKTPYFFETTAEDDWMGRHFFTAGVMPSDNLPYRFQDDLKIKNHWRINGRHYQRTAEAWLKNLDAAKGKTIPVIQKVYGHNNASRWFQRWRIFFMACAELWGFRGGKEWLVSHYLMAP
jgi:cyclopropane-fatty-acyl-phospholipid synthase